ncbi:alginate export family protein [Methylobacillus gramineus]|uniref:alginate export family protein n=1 Tax=Methylobacillus gramineus TaxID=755169 RepID=UPI001CFF59FE|nr:alginate export family protein [Methylobacillus gramineus]MCB5185078.1 alginate export family protein [Methylobacillus gramineus]
MFKKSGIIELLIASGIALSSGLIYAAEEVTTTLSAEEADQQERIKARKAELAAEAAKAKKAEVGYWVAPRAYGTTRESEPPKFTKPINKTWLKDYTDIDWLDVGADYRFRYENRENDFRRGTNVTDEPFLLRSRIYVAVRNKFDPLRFTLEAEDARRNHSNFTRDNRDVDLAEPIQAYAELFFKDALGKDDLDNDRPVSIKAGRMAFEQLDRRLIARNEWRNTTNTFQGVRATFGQHKNDWELDLFALQPIVRFTEQLNQRDKAQWFYGAVFDWRKWSDIVTLSPSYFYLKQDGDEVKYTSNGTPATAAQRIDREIHTAGLRGYGVIGKTGFDYDASYYRQWGEEDRTPTAKRDHRAYSYIAEVGYTADHAWKPRFSANYGVASGNKASSVGTQERFDRLFGFARPWSSNDYIQMENVNSTKIRAEFSPFTGVNIDTGYSWYKLDSATDRWNAGNNLTDATGNSGRDLGEEWDIRVRFPVIDKVSANVGYAYFKGGDFTKATSQRIEAGRKDTSNFFYVELTVSAF